VEVRIHYKFDPRLAHDFSFRHIKFSSASKLLIRWIPPLIRPERESDYSPQYGRHRECGTFPTFIHSNTITRLVMLFRV
jgi:hypothetical protein